MTTTYYYSSQYEQKFSNVLDKVTVDFSSDDTAYVEGSKVLWDVHGTVAAASSLYVLDYDSSRTGEYVLAAGNKKPHIKIKCSADCSVYNVTVKIASTGATLYTFASNYSSTAIYIVLNLTSTGLWQLA
jgi:hypothetical protein